MKINKINFKKGYFNEEIAEIIGIIYGDGNLYIGKNNTYRINITGNKETDYNYLTNYVSDLFERNFDIKPKVWIYKYRKAIAINIYSKKLLDYFIDLGLKVGPKKNLKIPDIILKNEKYKARFLRGLLDTDFCLYFRKRKNLQTYPRVISMFSDFDFVKELKILFSQFYIKANLYPHKTKLDNKTYLQYGIDISGKENLAKLIKNINFRNENHLVKLKLWQRDGFCKSHLSFNSRKELLNANI